MLLFSHISEARGVNLRCYCFYLSIEVTRYTWQVACSPMTCPKEMNITSMCHSYRLGDDISILGMLRIRCI